LLKYGDMSLQIGIVGLPNVGKSTLFNALLKKRVALSANYPFATVEPNVGVMAVPDFRLERLARIIADEHGSLPPIVPAVVKFVDIAGLVKGAHKGEGLGNKFLSHIREVDAIVHVLRDFSNEDVIRSGSVDPREDKEVVEAELALADLQVLENAKIKIQKSKLQIKNQNEVVDKLYQELGQGRQARDLQLTDAEKEEIKSFGLLMLKPVLYVVNVDEDRIGEIGEIRDSGGEMRICAKLEEELADLGEDERMEYLKSVGLEQTGLERLIVAAYKLLGLISFLTAGPKEVKAWTIKSGTKAPQAAGVIHTDFEKNFIRAQVIEYERLIETGSFAEAKKRGLIRTEGKDYIVQDGDVIEFMVGS